MGRLRVQYFEEKIAGWVVGTNFLDANNGYGYGFGYKCRKLVPKYPNQLIQASKNAQNHSLLTKVTLFSSVWADVCFFWQSLAHFPAIFRSYVCQSLEILSIIA